MIQKAKPQGTVLMMAGGTGGHVFPALAVARELQQRGFAVEWLGSRHGIENELVPQAGIPLHCIAVQGLRGKGRLSLALAPWRLLQALGQALTVLRRCRPVCVIGMGGFASGPGGLAAWLLRKPLYIHEQNAIAGLTNRVLARFARRVFEAFPGAFEAGPKVCLTGNPVREDIMRLAPPEQRYGERQGAIRILVVGGSLGAQAINETLPQALALLPPQQRPQVWHQSGRNKDQATHQHYAQAGIEARIEPFITDMPAALAWADLVICRAGALTLAEVCAAGVASLLVPYPYAVDDHQTANARYLAQAGAAELVAQASLTPAALAQLLAGPLARRETLLTMAQAARNLAMPEATQDVVKHCLETMP